MNEKIKSVNNKGITLIALIITIVVLLIIAIVSVGALEENDIIAHAENASSSYKIEQEKEEIELALMEWQLENSIPGNSTDLKTLMER